MTVQEFKTYFESLIQETRFERLLWPSAWEDPDAAAYLKGRKMSPEICQSLGTEVFTWGGLFRYLGKDYRVRPSVVVPLYGISKSPPMVDSGYSKDPGDAEISKSPTEGEYLGNPEPRKQLIGVWIRFLQEKRFFIWLLPEFQKMWYADPKEHQYHPDIGDTWVLFESIFDAFAFSSLTKHTKVAACLGVSPSGDLQEFLRGQRVLLALDQDEAGKKSSLNLLTSNPGWGIIIPELNGKDYNEHLTTSNHLRFQVLHGIQAKIKLRSAI